MHFVQGEREQRTVGAAKGESSTQLCDRGPRLPDPRSQRKAAPDGSLSCGSAERQPANPRVTRRRCTPARPLLGLSLGEDYEKVQWAQVERPRLTSRFILVEQ